MKAIACPGVPTARRDAGSQRPAIPGCARTNGFRIDGFVEATARGKAAPKHRRPDGLTGMPGRGDRPVVSELSRHGRPLGRTVAVLDGFAKAGVAFIAIRESIRVEGRQDIRTRVMTTLFAEAGRDPIPERPREGLAEARASGRTPGCPKGSPGASRLDGREDEIRQSVDPGVSRTAIAKITGVSRSTLYSFMAVRGLKPGP